MVGVTSYHCTLMSGVRRRIENYVHSNPGVHFNEIVRNLNLGTGQTQYHLRKLLGSGALVAEHRYGKTHYFDGCHDAWERSALTLLRRETDRAIVTLVLETGHLSPASIAENLDIARSTVEWHLDRLTSENILEKEYDDTGRVSLRVVDPDATRSLLSTIEPGLSDRFLDRFTRLVDDALESK